MGIMVYSLLWLLQDLLDLLLAGLTARILDLNN